ncbi:unnamed protein product [Mytilus edulis]|uniref:Uncharacterized protein n=1 Tax=Mytilus edulis TaxID=6550 RepID=A0A8S3UF34_MYTED|nr:unnamed protein product [Mytilus edulis]
MDRSYYLMVAALDLGTTYSGFAFAFNCAFEEHPIEIHCYQAWYTGRGQLRSHKIPTCVLLYENKELKAVGYEAEQEFAYICEEAGIPSDQVLFVTNTEAAFIYVLQLREGDHYQQFKNGTEYIVVHLGDKKDSYKHNKTVDMVVVGEFVECSIVLDAVEKCSKKRIIILKDWELAVMKGAVLYGLHPCQYKYISSSEVRM